MLCRNGDSKGIKQRVTIRSDHLKSFLFCAVLHWEMLLQPNWISSQAGSSVRNFISRKKKKKKKRVEKELIPKGERS